jgi:hypothetical protein
MLGVSRTLSPPDRYCREAGKGIPICPQISAIGSFVRRGPNRKAVRTVALTLVTNRQVACGGGATRLVRRQPSPGPGDLHQRSGQEQRPLQ